MYWDQKLGDKLIVVDIQPAYIDAIDFSLSDFVQALFEYDGNVLYFYNGENLGLNTKKEIKEWLINIFIEQSNSDEEIEQFNYKLNNINFVEKDYGFLRNLIDNGYEDDVYILLKFMIDNNYTSSFDFKDEDYNTFKIDETLKLMKL